ncbi:Protein of unknown function DUF459 [Rhabdaerophilaceae bacterium]
MPLHIQLRSMRYALAVASAVFAVLFTGSRWAVAQFDGPSVMNWRAGSPEQSVQRRAAPTYRARRRGDQISPRLSSPGSSAGRLEDDSALGLHMAAPRVPVPVIADPSAPRLAIIGDSMAEALVFGFEADPGIRAAYSLVKRTHSSSGLVRDDFFNWPENLSRLIAENPGLAGLVIMIGLNDRQAIRGRDATHEPLSDGWREDYKTRVDALLTRARDARIPVFWVGLPQMRTARLSSELAAIGEIMRERVAVFGQTFVETTDAFSDAVGGFSATGPDIIGDIVRLRGPDGIHFTPAGQRKLAFFVERPMRRVLGANTVSAVPAVANAPVPAIATPGPMAEPTPAEAISLAIPVIIPRDPVIALKMRPPIGERHLLGEVRQAGQLLRAGPPSYADVTAKNLFDRGLAPEARPGRSDDHSWR